MGAEKRDGSVSPSSEGARASVILALAPPEPGSEPIAELLESCPAWVGRLVLVLVWLAVEIAPADVAKPRTIGAAEDLLRKLERNRIPRPLRELEPVVDDVRARKLLVAGILAGVILAPVDRNLGDGVLETAHAWSVEACAEAEPEDVAAGGTTDRELSRHLGWDREIPLTAELERLELDLDLVAMLITRAQAEPT